MRTIAKQQSVSAAREDYIRAIYILQSETGSTSVTKIAERLTLSKSTVSERVKDLVEAGFVQADPYAAVSLTTAGEKLGAQLTFKHRVIEVFLNSVLKVPKDRVHDEAEKLEHAVSDDVIKRLYKFLQHPTNDPHGSAIPKITNWK